MERRSSRVSPRQWDILLDFLERNVSLARGYHNSARGREQTQRQWHQLAQVLNAEGSGAHKSPKEWATYFNNFKSKLKKLVAGTNREATATVGGPPSSGTLSELENRVLAIMGPGFGQSIAYVQVNPFPNENPSREVHEPVFYLDMGCSMGGEANNENPEMSLLEVQEEPAAAVSGVAEGVRVSPLRETVSPSQAGQSPHQRHVPRPRQTRRVRHRTRPMAPIDEARRILTEVEMQRAAADAAKTRALELIAENLGRIADAINNLSGNN